MTVRKLSPTEQTWRHNAMHWHKVALWWKRAFLFLVAALVSTALSIGFYLEWF